MNGTASCAVLFLVILCVISINAYLVEPAKKNQPKTANKFEDVYRWKQITFTPLDNGTTYNICDQLNHALIERVSNSQIVSDWIIRTYTNYFWFSLDSIIFGLTDKRLNDITLTEVLENYVPANNLPTGISLCKDRIFVAIPRRRNGVPATIAYVRKGGKRGSSPSLHAYPDFRTNQLHVSSIRVASIIILAIQQQQQQIKSRFILNETATKSSRQQAHRIGV